MGRCGLWLDLTGLDKSHVSKIIREFVFEKYLAVQAPDSRKYQIGPRALMPGSRIPSPHPGFLDMAQESSVPWLRRQDLPSRSTLLRIGRSFSSTA